MLYRGRVRAKFKIVVSDGEAENAELDVAEDLDGSTLLEWLRLILICELGWSGREVVQGLLGLCSGFANDSLRVRGGLRTRQSIGG